MIPRLPDPHRPRKRRWRRAANGRVRGTRSAPRPPPARIVRAAARMSDATPSFASAAPAPIPVERVVLLGYMTSGKSAVGAAVARRLAWEFVDFDVEIERRAGVTVHA